MSGFMQQSLGLRTKILLGFGGLLAILLAVSALGSYVFSRYIGATQLMLRQDYDSVSACGSLKSAIDLNNAMLERTLLGDTLDSRAQAAANAADFERALSLQRDNLNLPGEREATEKVAQLWKLYQDALPQVLDASRSLHERRESYARNIHPTSGQLLAAVRHIVEINRDNLTSTQGEAQTLARNARYAMHALTGIGVLIACAFGVAIGRMILRPLRNLTESVLEIRRGNLDASVPVLSTDEFGHLAAAFNDMAGQLRALRRVDHEKLMRTQRTTQLAIDSLPDPVLVVNAQRRIELTNQAGRNWFGFEPGAAVADFAIPWLDAVLAQIAKPAPTDNTGYDSTILHARDGKDYYLLPRAVPILDEEKKVIGATVVLNDVTGLRRLDQMKSGLLALVSHELKTPLTSMRMILHLVVDEKIAPRGMELRDLLLTARDDSDRLHQIVENLLDMGRIESGKVLMELKPTPVNQLMERSVEQLRGAFGEQGIALEVEPAANNPLVSADANRIGHVFVNLLANALRYTPTGGKVRVGVMNTTVSIPNAARGAIEAHQDDIECYVSDNGPGIPGEYADRIFEKFFRVPGQPRHSGAGLGLAIARDIVEAHGGRIAVDTAEGNGCTFRFTLKRPEQGNGQ